MTTHQALAQIRRITSEWLVTPELDANFTIQRIAGVLLSVADQSADNPAIANALTEIEREEVSQLRRELARLGGIDPDTAKQKAQCWDDVVELLTKVSPGWSFAGNASLRDLALKAIRRLAEEHAARAEARIDVIGQNGNTGEHYPKGKEPERPPHTCAACGGGHALHRCQASERRDATQG